MEEYKKVIDEIIGNIEKATKHLEENKITIWSYSHFLQECTNKLMCNEMLNKKNSKINWRLKNGPLPRLY